MIMSNEGPGGVAEDCEEGGHQQQRQAHHRQHAAVPALIVCIIIYWRGVWITKIVYIRLLLQIFWIVLYINVKIEEL